jgi:hypothetical protein
VLATAQEQPREQAQARLPLRRRQAAATRRDGSHVNTAVGGGEQQRSRLRLVSSRMLLVQPSPTSILTFASLGGAGRSSRGHKRQALRRVPNPRTSTPKTSGPALGSLRTLVSAARRHGPRPGQMQDATNGGRVLQSCRRGGRPVSECPGHTADAILSEIGQAASTRCGSVIGNRPFAAACCRMQARLVRTPAAFSALLVISPSWRPSRCVRRVIRRLV